MLLPYISEVVLYGYIDLGEECIIVKTLVTESPLTEVDGIKVPTLEKLFADAIRMSIPLYDNNITYK